MLTGEYNPSALETMLRHVNGLTLVGWTMRKFKRFHGRKGWGCPLP